MKKIFKSILIIYLSAGLVSIVLAQRQTGSIKGKIIDQQGNPLPGAFIYVSSPAMLGMRTYMTSDTGIIRFPGLLPGSYKIIVEMPGFKTLNIENIIIRIGKTVTLNITLEMSTIEEETVRKVLSPTIDVESTKTATNIDKELLKNIPFNKDLHDIVNSAAGVIPERVPYQKTSFVHGSTARANTYAFEGITMNDPAGRHLLTNINFDAIEEVELETASHPAEVGFTDGAYINVVTKSGGNRFSGEANLYRTSDKLTSTLRSDEEISGTGASPPPMDKNLWDISFSLGGPLLEDKLWFFANTRLISQTQSTPFIPWTDPQGKEHGKFDRTNNEKMGFFKLISQFTPQIKLTGMFNYVDRKRSVYESSLSWNLPEEATRILDHEKNFFAAGVLNYIIDQNTFVDVKAGTIRHQLPFLLNEKGRENAQYFNEGKGHFWGSAGFNETQIKRRFQAGVYLTRFQDGFLGGNHEFKAGAEYEHAAEELNAWKADNLLMHYYDGSPNYFGQDVSPVTGNPVDKGKIFFYLAGKEERAGKEEIQLIPKHELGRLSFFVQDSVTFGGRLTLLLGLRFDRSNTKLLAHIKGESGNPVSLKIGEEIIRPLYDVNPYAENGFPEWKDMIIWNALSPRIGLSFDILGNGKAILKASFSRYTDYLALDYILALNPFYARRSHQFYWFDEDRDEEVDENDTYTLFPEDYRFYNEEYYKKTIAPDLKSPYTDEFTVGFHYEAFQDFSFRINYIHKTKENIFENVLYDPDSDKDWYAVDQDAENWWIPFETIVPGVDEYPDTPVTVYYWSNDAPSLFYRVKNVPELNRKYQALEIAFEKRMSNNWQLYGSFVLSKATGNTGFDYGASSGFPGAAESPKYIPNLPQDSRLDFDRPLAIKLMGTYKLPYDFFLSFYYTYLSGIPWARSVTIIPSSSWIQEKNAYSAPVNVYLEKPEVRRREPYSNLDLRVEKEFRLGNSGGISVYVDIVNVLGNKYDFTFQNDGGFWYPEDEKTSQGIRILSSNYKNITSLFGTRMLRLGLRLSF